MQLFTTEATLNLYEQMKNNKHKRNKDIRNCQSVTSVLLQKGFY